MLNNNKQLNTNPQAINIANSNLSGISIFKDKADTFLLYKKTEKILSAVYLISNLISDNEPLKWQLRETVISLLKDSFILSSKQNHTVNPDQSIVFNTDNFILKSLELISFLDTSFYTNLISEMNFNIIKNEIDKTVKSVEGKRIEEQNKQLIFSEDFFQDKTVETQISNYNNQASSPLSINNQPKGQNLMSDRNNKSLNNNPKNIKDTIRPSEQKQLVKSNRQDIIISMLKTKGNLGIKDFVSGIKDCSEKTIQRELITLLDKGQISKIGEKRWSRYSIKVS